MWADKYFALRSKHDKLSRELERLLGISPRKLEQYRDNAKSTIRRNRTEIKNLEGTIQNIIKNKAEAEAVLRLLHDSNKEVLLELYNEVARQKRAKTIIISFIIGFISSLVASLVIYLLAR